MAERKTGAGSAMQGVLERAVPPPKPAEPGPPEPDAESVEVPMTEDAPEAEPTPAKGRAVGTSKAGRTGGSSLKAKKCRPRTFYLSEALFERIIVQAHRRHKTLSEYVGDILERQVPDHRRGRDADAAA